MNKYVLTCLLSICLACNLSGQHEVRNYGTLGLDDWKFKLGDHPESISPEFDDASWQTVSIPHDWAITGPFIKDGNGDTGKLPWKGVGWYRKRFDVPNRETETRYVLMFDGVMAFPEVFVNGEFVGKWDYGYNSFKIDVTDYIKPGAQNILAVKADTRQHDSRWYPGAGIYRKVTLLELNPIHFDIWSHYVTTPIIKPHYAEVRIRTTINNYSDSDDSITVRHYVFGSKMENEAVATVGGWVKKGGQRTFESTVVVNNPRLWDVDDPNQYMLVSMLVKNEDLIDERRMQFGIRSIRFTPDDGFYLNDKRVQLKGVNLHHDHGPLGGAFYPAAMRRQLEIMKDMGVNAIRNSHNTAAPELLDMCDEMGLLFFNEIFDKYDGKAGITEDTDFEEFAHRNIKNFVTRDRNHPSVFLWSVGNEIGDVQWNQDLGHWRLHTMLNYVNKYDPTRPTTLVNDNTGSAVTRHFDYYDVHCWNYNRRYKLARQMEPNKSVIISESASTLSTRGFYELPLPEEKTDFTKSLQVSSYDLNAPWWAEIADDDFMWQQDETYVAGEFVWTGFDYLGEPTPYNNKYVRELGFDDDAASRSSYFGIVDLVGIPKDRFYLYKSYWKPEDTTIHILPHWNWDGMQGKNVPVFVYTNGDCAELFVNGKSQGLKCKDPRSGNSVDRFRLMWNDVIYQPGKLEVNAYKNSKPIGSAKVVTTGSAHILKLSPEHVGPMNAGGRDLKYILVEAYDKDGNVVPLANNRVQIEIKGPAEIAGVGNGNPQSFEPFQATYVDLFYGKAMIILKSGKKTGRVEVIVTSDGLKSDNHKFDVN